MIQLEALAGHHARSAFDCGSEPLNRWLAQTALQHQTKGISRTFVAVNADDPVDGAAGEQILGFYALAAGFVLIDELPPSLRKKYPRQIPITRLGRLAVDLSLQVKGWARSCSLMRSHAREARHLPWEALAFLLMPKTPVPQSFTRPLDLPFASTIRLSSTCRCGEARLGTLSVGRISYAHAIPAPLP